MSGSSQGITLRDVAVLAFVGCLLLPAAAAVVRNANNGGTRVGCASNLRQIGQAIMVYANAHKNGPFPRTTFDALPQPVPTEYTGVNAANPFQLPGGPGPNDVTSGLYLLLRVAGITSEPFVCPSPAAPATRFIPPPGSAYASFSNFASRGTLSYAYTNPYPSDVARKMGFKMNYTLASDFAIAADMGPGPAAAQVPADANRRKMATANSPNHRGEGQNVLYADGHVDWSATPFVGSPRPVAGSPRDNIYAFGADTNRTTSSAGVRGAAQDQFDTVILPSFDMGPQPGPIPAPDFALPSAGDNPAVLVVSAALLFLAAGVAVLVLRRRAGRANRVPPGSPA